MEELLLFDENVKLKSILGHCIFVDEFDISSEISHILFSLLMRQLVFVCALFLVGIVVATTPRNETQITNLPGLVKTFAFEKST